MKQAFHSHRELCDFFCTWNNENDIPPRHEKHKDRQLLSEVQHLEHYLRTLSHFEKLAFPFEVEKSESPDFLIKNNEYIIGLEVTQATDPHFQAWLSRISNKEGGHMYNAYSPTARQPEATACACVLEKIHGKANLLQGYYNNHPIHHCDLLLNISLDCFLTGEVLFKMLQKEIHNYTFGFRLMSIIADNMLLFAINTPQAQLLAIPAVE